MKMTPNFELTPLTYTVMKFPSGELQVQLNKVISTEDGKFPNVITIMGSITSSDNLMELLQLVEALNFYSVLKLQLVLPYCAYSRQDRRCNDGESFSLKVFANLINSCNFQRVVTYDNHSEVATALLNNCYNIPVSDLIDNLLPYNFLISPDAGANKKVFDCSKQFKIPMLRADKQRDTVTGNILETIIYATKEQLDNATVLIIDDICANGRTFTELAKAIHTISPTCKVHLYVTHGFFSKGVQPLIDGGISQIFTTSSVCKEQHADLRVITLAE